MEVIYFNDIVRERDRRIEVLFNRQLEAALRADVDLAIELAIDIKKAKGTHEKE